MSATTKGRVLTGLIFVVLFGMVAAGGCKKSEPSEASKTRPVVAETKQATEAARSEADDKSTEVSTVLAQTICPVMGDKINKNVFTEYKGKKVYFCCQMCVKKFETNPGKYIAKLPQFK